MNRSNKENIPFSLVYENWSVPIVAFFLGVLTVWTFIGNVLVLVSLFRFTRLRSTSNILIGNLAVSDFLVSTAVLPFSTINDLLGYWVFGKILCNIWLSIDVLCCTASIWSLVAIAFDRFTATTFPIWYRDQRNNKRVATYIILVWVLSCLICLPPLIGWDGKTLEDPQERFQKSYILDNSTMRHRCMLFNDPHYVIYSAMGSFIIPLVVLIMLYAKIFVVLQKRAKLLRENRRKTTANANRNNLRMTQLNVTPSSQHKLNECSTSNSEECVDMNKQPIRYQVDETNECEVSVNLTTVQDNHSSTATPLKQTTSPFLELPNSGRRGSDTATINSETSSLCSPGMDRQKKNSKKNKALRALSIRKQRQREKERNARVDRREQRATKRMALIIFLFVLCWIPFTLMYIIRSFCQESCPDIHHLSMFIIWLGYANSGLNPILYPVFNEDFRDAFITLLCPKSMMTNYRNRRHH